MEVILRTAGNLGGSECMCVHVCVCVRVCVCVHVLGAGEVYVSRFALASVRRMINEKGDLITKSRARGRDYERA